MNIISSILICSMLVAVSKNDAARDVAAAERSFSSLSEKQGITASFVEFLDDSCVMFNPGPVNGKELYRKRKENGAHLIWSPTFVEAASSGEFGISTGPWEYRREKGDTAASYGHYFSVWKKNSAGKWKVIFDNGIDYPSSVKRKEEEIIRSTSSRNVSATPIDDLEKSFNKFSAEQSLRTAYQRYLADDVRLYRKGSFPSASKNEAMKIIPTLETQHRFIVFGSSSAASGEMAYTYGLSIDQKSDTSSFAHVWRWNEAKGWRISIDIMEAFPK